MGKDERRSAGPPTKYEPLASGTSLHVLIVGSRETLARLGAAPGTLWFGPQDGSAPSKMVAYWEKEHRFRVPLLRSLVADPSVQLIGAALDLITPERWREARPGSEQWIVVVLKSATDRVDELAAAFSLFRGPAYDGLRASVQKLDGTVDHDRTVQRIRRVLIVEGERPSSASELYWAAEVHVGPISLTVERINDVLDELPLMFLNATSAADSWFFGGREPGPGASR